MGALRLACGEHDVGGDHGIAVDHVDAAFGEHAHDPRELAGRIDELQADDRGYDASAAGILNPLGAFLAIALGACFGNTVAYGIGYFLGSKIYDGSIKWIDQQQMAKTQAFFAKHGKLTIVLARFVPIIRSFAPLVAGAAKMSRLNFEVSGTVGAVLWAGIILAAGHLFGNIPFIKNNLSLILVGGIVLGLAPFVIGYIVKKWRQHPDEK